MRITIFTSLFFLLAFTTVKADTQHPLFDKSSFYNALASDDMDVINTQLSALKSSALLEKEAYEGTLLMKKAGLVAKLNEKLSLFKAGRIKLEAAIKKDKENAEFSFLRLIIQEHAPKIVNYNNNIQADAAAIRFGYKTLPPVVQQAINDYSKKSKVLKLT